MKRLQQLFASLYHQQPATVQPIHGSGSNRQYLRLADTLGHSVVGVVGTSAEENEAFITLSRHFRSHSLPVPEVLAVSPDRLCYLQQDLGSRSLFDALASAREAGGHYDDHQRQLLRHTIRLLPHLQIAGARDLDFDVCYPAPALDATGIGFDLNYFKYCFLKPSGVEFHELQLEQDFRALTHDLLLSADTAALPPTFLYRDFQARNVMLDADDQPWFIDFQGGRRGPLYYDLASFLWQASARYPQTLRDELLRAYWDEVSILLPDWHPNPEEQTATLRRFVLFRLLQVLGAYGYRGYFERKQHFLQSIPPALDSLRQLLQQPEVCPYPYLRSLLSGLAKSGTLDLWISGSPELQHSTPPVPLTVTINSFSYRSGIPHDESGNGGGYVFDCRSTHNPGRYDPYKPYTGLDEPVIRFLEDDGEILTFLDHVYALADFHVQRYLQLGFTHLMFSFGCTGGQHRSVYAAQHLAEHLHQQFPGLHIMLHHIQQNIHHEYQ